ncbi:cytosine permease [Porticoccus sp. GXU_MW_L64]
MKIENFTDNHTDSPVPKDSLVGGVKIAAVLVGVAITLPAFLVGSQVIGALGLIDGVLAILLAGAILTGIAILAMYVGAKTRLSTAAIITEVFGSSGARLVNLAITISLLGWYGVTLSIFVDSLGSAFDSLWGFSPGKMTLMVLGSSVMIGTTIYGFRAIELLSRAAVPIMLFVLLSSVFIIIGKYDFVALSKVRSSELDVFTFQTAVTSVVSAFIVGVTISPDLSRFAKNPREGVKASFLSYGSFSLLVLLMAGLPALVTGELDIIKNIQSIGLGLLGLLMMVFATWTTNVSNLYSSSLSSKQLVAEVKDWQMTLSLGVLGAILASIGILDNFIDFLIVLGAVFPPVCGIYIAHYLFTPLRLTKNKYDLQNVNASAMLCWIGAILVSFVFQSLNVSVTTIPSLDSFLLGCCLYGSTLLVRHFMACQ